MSIIAPPRARRHARPLVGPVVPFVVSPTNTAALIEAQRAELHLDLDDAALAALACRANHPRRPLARRLLALIRQQNTAVTR